jgi:hypothetical protein
MATQRCSPELRVDSDYDRYFESLVDKWIDEKRVAGGTFRHEQVRVTAGPYRSSAVSFRSFTLEDGKKIIHLDFYSALRSGFGSLSAQDIVEIKELL